MNVLFTSDDDPLRFIFIMLYIVVDVEGVLIQPGKVMKLENIHKYTVCINVYCVYCYSFECVQCKSVY